MAKKHKYLLKLPIGVITSNATNYYNLLNGVYEYIFDSPNAKRKKFSLY